MRSFLIIFATLLIAVGLFAVYLWREPALPKRPAKSTVSTVRTPRAGATTATQQSVHGVGGIESPWVKRFENGELTSQFRSLRSTPKGGDVVEVTKPEAQFFSDDGSQMLVVEGASGEVIVPGGGSTDGNRSTGGQNFSPPSRGQLRDVRISMFEPADAAEPTLVATMPNAVFDNDTFRISTEAYTDDSGKRVEADQVPVVVEGKDYDFRGRGLVIRWNQRDRRLQLLEVQHGESLTVKNFDAMSLDRKGEGAQGRERETEMLASVDPIAPAMLLAAAQSKAKKATPRPAPVTTKASTRDTSPVVYRATFDTDVKIFEADKQVATAERLEIDILQAEDGHGTAASTQPTTRASRRDRRRSDATSAPTTTASTSPAVQGPVTVKWTGKLRVVPLEEPADPKLVAGKAIVRMTGSPVKIEHTDMQAKAGVVAFNSADGSASLRANEIVPIVELTTPDGSTVTTPSVVYAAAGEGRRVATLAGKSTAVLTAKGQKTPLRLTWTKDARLQFVEPTSGKSVMENATFAGDVHIVHPDLDMTSQTLDLKFDPTRAVKTPTPTAKPAEVDPADSLREIVADGGVNCRITEAGAEARRIASNRLLVQLDRSPAGETYARLIHATGEVRTNQGKDSLSAGDLKAELAPATQPTAGTATVDASDSKPANSPFGGGGSQLRSLVATNAVKLATQDGSSATADRLTVETVDGRERYLLEGKPVATVTQGQTVISGPLVRFRPDEQLAEVVGAGGMKGTLPDDPKESFDVTWAGGAAVNGATNRIDVTQQVVIASKQEDGTINTATSDQLQATLEPKPATQPTALKAAAAATKPSQKDKMNFLAGKEVTTATLLADAGKRVEVKSELFGPDGGLLRGLNLYATKIVTNRATGRLNVPVPGEMLYQDHRPPEQKAARKPAAEGPTLGSGRGKTAFQWKESLAYDDTQKRVTMTGEVVVVHHPEAGAKDAQPFNLWADTLTADLEADPNAAKLQGAGAGAAVAKPSQSRMRLKVVTAAGRVRVQSTRLNVDASRLSYDPVVGILRAAGDETSPITVFDKEKGTSSTVGELEWNTKTDQFRVKELSGKVRT